jgi:hypothetical protein
MIYAEHTGRTRAGSQLVKAPEKTPVVETTVEDNAAEEEKVALATE